MRAGGRGGRILNAVARLSNLNLFMIKGAPAGVKGRTDCFKLEADSCTTVAFDLTFCAPAQSADFMLSAISST